MQPKRADSLDNRTPRNPGQGKVSAHPGSLQPRAIQGDRPGPPGAGQGSSLAGRASAARCRHRSGTHWRNAFHLDRAEDAAGSELTTARIVFNSNGGGCLTQRGRGLVLGWTGVVHLRRNRSRASTSSDLHYLAGRHRLGPLPRASWVPNGQRCPPKLIYGTWLRITELLS